MSIYDYDFTQNSLTTWAQLRNTWFAMNKVVEMRLNEIGLTHEAISILWVCRDYPGPLYPAEIARLVFRTPHTVTALLKRLEKEGLITKIPKEPGHPITEVQLTEKGREVSEPGIAILKDVIAEIMAALSDEEMEKLVAPLRSIQSKALDMLYMKVMDPPEEIRDITIPVKKYKRRKSR